MKSPDGRQAGASAQLRNCYYTFIQEMTAESEGTISEMALSVFSTWDSIKIFHLHNNGMLGGLCRQLETGGGTGLLRISFITAQRLPHEIELGQLYILLHSRNLFILTVQYCT